MDATNPMSADLQNQQDRKRKRKALLAGGVVLGLGAAVTLAAWSDDVFASGDFATGSFELQGSTTGEAESFQSYPEAGPASVTFALAPNDLAPGDVVYAPFHLGVNGTREASVELTAVTGTDASTLNEKLSYEIFQTDTCSETTTGTANFSGTVDATVETNDAVTAPMLSATATGVPLCIVVTAEAAADGQEEDFPQGATTTVTWQFTGTQIDE